MSLMSLFQSFSGAKPEASGQPPVSAEGQTGQSGTPTGNESKSGEATQTAPLDDAASWFKVDEKDAKPFEFDASKLIDQSPEAQAKLQEAVNGLNFMQGVATPEALAKLEAGGPEAIQVTLAMMNKLAQSTFLAATQAATKINETAISKASPQIDSKIAAILKSRDTTNAIKEANPVLQKPGAQFIVDTLAERLQTKYPTATPDEIKTMAKKFVTDFSSVANPVEPSAADTSAKAEGDYWTDFMK